MRWASPTSTALPFRSSRVEPMGSREQKPRIGKSLRKKGVNSEALLADLALIEEQVNQQLADRIAAGARSAAAALARRPSIPATGTSYAGRSGGDHPLWRYPCCPLAELGEVKVQLTRWKRACRMRDSMVTPTGAC